MKKSDKDLNVPSDKRTFKKRYILRVYEEQEAQQEIKQYEDSETGSSAVRLDGLGFDGLRRSEGELP